MLLNLIRLIPWITKQPFSASYWAFSFGITAIAIDAMIFVMRGLNGSILWMAKGLFIIANFCILILVIKTVHLLLSKKLLPPPLPQLVK
jgi:tellurite resistance protein